MKGFGPSFIPPPHQNLGLFTMPHPILEQLSNRKNQNNFLLQNLVIKNNIVCFIWPTTESGGYFRVTSLSRAAYDEMVKSNLALDRALESTVQSIFETTPTREQLGLANVFLNSVNEIFFNKPIFDISKFTVLHSHVRLELFVKGDIFLEDDSGYVLQLTSSNMFLDPLS